MAARRVRCEQTEEYVLNLTSVGRSNENNEVNKKQCNETEGRKSIPVVVTKYLLKMAKSLWTPLSIQLCTLWFGLDLLIFSYENATASNYILYSDVLPTK